ncbi:methyl-accepting chemotaxis protein [Effusibacillus lacus]|uniref:methyl-accepting chemotaxis protein n=1 Tax=Effusibacillus lacus TaxID=1348429 RepID=UPI000BB9B876|nr:methyl-accepting chemotaxis protein [Effusibacillus lacus]
MADEVRQLAEQSNQDASEVTGLVQKILGSSANAVQAMQQSRIEVEEGGTPAILKLRRPVRKKWRHPPKKRLPLWKQLRRPPWNRVRWQLNTKPPLKLLSFNRVRKGSGL